MCSRCANLCEPGLQSQEAEHPHAQRGEPLELYPEHQHGFHGAVQQHQQVHEVVEGAARAVRGGREEGVPEPLHQQDDADYFLQSDAPTHGAFSTRQQQTHIIDFIGLS